MVSIVTDDKAEKGAIDPAMPLSVDNVSWHRKDCSSYLLHTKYEKFSRL